MKRSLPRLARTAALLLFFLAAWLLVPRVAADGPRRPAVRVLLIDASASTRRVRPDWTSWARRELRREAAAARESDEELCVIAFAADVSVRFGPAAPARFEGLLEGRGDVAPFDPAEGSGSDAESRLADAVTLASSFVLDPERAPGRLVLLGDGEFTGSDPAPALATLGARGIACAHTALPAPSLGELGLARLEVPSTVEVGAPLVATAQVTWRPGAGAQGAELRILLEEAGVRRSVVHPLALPADGGTWTEPVALGQAGLGRTEVTVTAVHGPGPDPVPENDAVSAVYRGEGNLAIGVVADEASLAAARQAFEPSGVSALAGLEFVFAPVQELGTIAPDLDALVVFDVAPAHVPADLVETFVRSGGGLLVTSGWRFLTDWIPGRTPGPFLRLLPLLPAATEAPPRDVILMVDGSGSMAGEPFDMVRAAAIALVGAALPGDRLSLRFFTTGLEQELLLRERLDVTDPDKSLGGELVAERLLAARVPGGQTMILRSLRQFADEQARRGTEALVLLLSDGRERGGLARPREAAADALALLRSARTKLEVIAVGDEYDETFLALLAGEGDVSHAQTLSDLEGIFRRSIGGARVREGVVPVAVAAHAPDSLAAEVLGAGASEPLPSLARLVKNTLVPGAELLWESDEAEPVLAAWRVGTGRTALFSSLPRAGWAPAWTDRVGLGEPRVFGPLLRWIARSDGARPEAPVLRIDGRSLVLSGVPPEMAPLVTVRLVGPRGELERVVLEPRLSPSGVVAAGVREGRLVDPDMAAAVGLCALVPLEGSELVVRVERPVPREFRSPGHVRDLLGGSAPGRSGGTSGTARQHPLGPWALSGGLLVLLLGFLSREGRQGIRAAGR